MAKFTNEVLYKILLTRIILEVILKYTKSSNAGIFVCIEMNLPDFEYTETSTRSLKS